MLRLALEALALLSDVARGRVVLHHQEGIPRLRHALGAEHLDRGRGPGHLDRLAALVVHRAHAAGVLAADEGVAQP